MSFQLISNILSYLFPDLEIVLISIFQSMGDHLFFTFKMKRWLRRLRNRFEICLTEVLILLAVIEPLGIL